jgi:putative ABC transport system ATP-binding protein
MATPATTTAPVVEIAHLNKSYRRGNQVLPVLQDISLDIFAGEFLALMGPSGSGKTTLLNLIAGLDRPDSGRLLVHGIDLPSLTETQLADWRAANVGFVFQFYQLIPVLTAFENVELPLLLTKLRRRSSHFPSELSGGQQQRVAIARALVTDPTLIAADEPTGDLDRKSAGEILDLLTRLNQDFHKTIIIVTHDPEAASHAGHIRRLIKGQLLNNMEPGAE